MLSLNSEPFHEAVYQVLSQRLALCAASSMPLLSIQASVRAAAGTTTSALDHVNTCVAVQFVFFGNGNWHAGIKGNHVKGRQSGINCVRFSDGSTIVYELPGLTVKGAEHEVVLVLRMSDDRILDAGCQGKLHGARQRLGQPVVVMCFLKYTFVPYPSSTCGCLMGAAMHQVRGRDEVCGPEEQAHVSQSVHNVTEVKFVVQKSVLIKFILSITLLTLPTQISLEEFVNMSHEVREMAEIREC
eukprot:scaffold54776_cov20-Tisochrysis_lutea.AAC.1